MPSDSLSELKPIHMQVLHALAAGVSVTEAAAAAGVHRTTVHHWCRCHPKFAATLRNARYERMSRVQEDLDTLTPSAIQVMRETLNDPQLPPSLRLRAALSVVKYASSYNIDTAVVTEEDLTRVQRMLLDIPPSDDMLAIDTPLPPKPPAQPEPLPSSEPEPSPRATTATTPTAEAPPPPAPRTPRNQKCPCGSGLKFKKCCLNRKVAAATQ
ncbi:MAG: SEC-C domain-containing protein [Bryobacterales bacterium]|nr:SEC-C domain-containing protein [Bryobacterales bacterium]